MKNNKLKLKYEYVIKVDGQEKILGMSTNKKAFITDLRKILRDMKDCKINF